MDVAMLRCFPLLFLLLASCNFSRPESPGPSVTVTLPPPQPVPAPGFSSPIAGRAG
jgi:hypothetical protein